jgi:hypothetical protein
MKLRTSFASLAVWLLLVSNGAAQLPRLSQESKEEKEKARKELEDKALSLLDDALQGAQTLKLAENRAVVRAQVADLLWKRDEKRARSLFHDAVMEVANAMGADGGTQDSSYWTQAQLRQQLLQMIAARDAQFALDLLRESRPAPGGGSGQSPAMADQELRLEQSIAAQAAANDPKAALKMAEESLDKGGVKMNVLGVLERLRQKDADSATRLAGEIVEKLQGERLAGEATFVAVSLLRTALHPQSPQQYFYVPYSYGASSSDRVAEKPKPLVMPDDAVRELADLVSSAALKLTPDANGLLMQINPLLPELSKLVPARAEQLRLKMAEMQKALDPDTKAGMRLDSLMSEGSPDAILEAAAGAPDGTRQGYYTYAAMKLMQSGDTERARQVISDNLSGQQREQMLEQVDSYAVSRAIDKGNLDDAKAVVSRIRSKEQRAAALTQLALAFVARGDRKAAAGLLDEARGLVNPQPENEKEVTALLEVARGYASVEPATTFEMIDPLIDRANEVLAAAALLEKFGAGRGVFRKGEMILSPGLGNVDAMYSRYARALSELARVDFDRTKAEAERFQREEVRIAARLLIARSILSDNADAGRLTTGEFYLSGS